MDFTKIPTHWHPQAIFYQWTSSFSFFSRGPTFWVGRHWLPFPEDVLGVFLISLCLSVWYPWLCKVLAMHFQSCSPYFHTKVPNHHFLCLFSLGVYHAMPFAAASILPSDGRKSNIVLRAYLVGEACPSFPYWDHSVKHMIPFMHSSKNGVELHPFLCRWVWKGGVHLIVYKQCGMPTWQLVLCQRNHLYQHHRFLSTPCVTSCWIIQLLYLLGDGMVMSSYGWLRIPASISL